MGHAPLIGRFGLSRPLDSAVFSFDIEADCSAHLQMGDLTGFEAINADLEIGATKGNPRFLRAAGLSAVLAGLALLATLGTTQVVRPAFAADDAATSCPERVGHWPYGYSNAVAVDGDTAFFAVGAALRIADASSPGDPVVLSEISLGNVILDMEISGGLLIAAVSRSGMAAVDISDPANPVLLDTLAVDDNATSVAIVGGHALIGGHSFSVVDLSDPSHLRVTGTLDSGIGWVRGMATSGGLGYLADRSYGLHVVDISDPSAPSLVATHSDDLDDLVSVDVSGDYAYALEEDNGIVIFDISNPADPTIVNRVDPGGAWFTRLHIHGGLLYTGHYYASELIIYDIGNPTTPVELWNDNLDYRQHHDFATVGTTLYSAQASHGLGITDVSTPSAPQSIGSSPGANKTRDIAQWDHYSLAVAGSGFDVFDLADPANPIELSRFGGVNPNDVVARDGYAYALDTTYLNVIDLRDPTAPEVAATIESGGNFVTLTGDLAVIDGSSDEIILVDIGDPSAPVEVARISVDYSVSHIAASGAAIYVPERDAGLHIYDVTVPSAPVDAGLVWLPEISVHILAAGNGLLALGEWGNGIRIYDVSDPLQPTETAFYTDLTQSVHLAISGDLLVVACRDEGLHILDLSDPSTPVHLGEAPLLVEYPTTLSALDGVALVVEEDAGFEIFELEACALEPPTAGFTWSPIRPWVGTAVEFTDTSTGGVTAWDWTFGDGDSSTESDPSHVYDSAGTFSVQLSVTGPMGADSVTRNITVTQDPPETPPIEQAGARQWVIPAAAHSPGAQGTNWVSDVVIHNPGSQTVSANVYFLKGGQNNSGIGGRLIEVPGETSVALDDIVQDRFGWSNASGAILIGCNSTLRISSRTYNNASSGTFGQFIRGLPVTDAAGTGESVRLIQLTRSNTFRTNIGWVNAGSSPINLTISLLDVQGASIGSHQSFIPPFGYGQANDILSGNVDDAMAVVSTNSSGATFFTYASVVDNSTGDPILILEGDNAAELYIPASAHVQGLAGTDWRTDLEIANSKTTAVECSIDLLKTGFANPTPKTVTVSVPGGGNVRVTDVLENLFDHDGSAALRLRTDGPKISATSSTFNTTSVGTYGQFISGTISDAAVTPTRSGQMIQLSQSAGNTDGFRTNLGMLNVTGIQVEVLIELFDSDGTSVGSGTTVLLPFEHRQINRIFREVTPAAITNGFAVVSTTTPHGAFLAYASVVDNRSGDPVYIPAWVK